MDNNKIAKKHLFTYFFVPENEISETTRHLMCYFDVKGGQTNKTTG